MFEVALIQKIKNRDIHDISYMERVKILKKWLIITSVLILCFIGLVAGAYLKALQPKNKAADIAFETAKAEVDMKTMERILSVSWT